MFALRLLSEGGEGPDSTLQWMLFVALAFFFLMVIVGWWVSTGKKDHPGVQREEHGHHEADDLTKIEGIGPKVAKVLNEAGIKTFEGLAQVESRKESGYVMKKLLAVFFFAAFVMAACGGEAEVTATPESVPAEFAGQTNPLGADAAAAGVEVFKTYCLACHGERGHGDGPAGAGLSPKPKNLPELAATVGDDYLFWRIAKGVPGTSMVGWKGALNDEQIWQVVSFIRTLK